MGALSTETPEAAAMLLLHDKQRDNSKQMDPGPHPSVFEAFLRSACNEIIPLPMRGCRSPPKTAILHDRTNDRYCRLAEIRSITVLHRKPEEVLQVFQQTHYRKKEEINDGISVSKDSSSGQARR